MAGDIARMAAAPSTMAWPQLLLLVWHCLARHFMSSLGLGAIALATKMFSWTEKKQYRCLRYAPDVSFLKQFFRSCLFDFVCLRLVFLLFLFFSTIFPGHLGRYFGNLSLAMGITSVAWVPPSVRGKRG